VHNSGRKLRLVGPRGKMNDPKRTFKCGATIPQSGIYRVIHGEHRLPHEVTLLEGQLFPKCLKCDESVMFELVRGAQDITVASFKVALYALPVEEDPAEGQDVTIAS